MSQIFKWCQRCVMPNTRPDLHFDEQGVCFACRAIEAKYKIDWKVRACQFQELVQWAKETARDNEYDCVAAVSGGKDSTFIVATLLRYGLRVLGVSAEPTMMTPEGQRNLENLQKLGIDVVQFKKNRTVYQKIGKFAFTSVGDHDYPNHLLIFTAVTKEACLRNISLLVFGEAPVEEYSGLPKAMGYVELDRKWLEEFGGLLGLRGSDLGRTLRLTEHELAPYTWPAQIDIDRVGLRSVFLGNFFLWDTVKQTEFVKAQCGFTELAEPPHGALWKFENVDCALEHWHDAMGYVKFGYDRAHAQASIAVRHGHMTRAEAVEAVRASTAGRLPSHSLRLFADYLGMNTDEVRAVYNAFVNREIFEFDGDCPRYERGSLVHRFPLA